MSRKGERNQRLQAGKVLRGHKGPLPSMKGASIVQFDEPEDARRETLHVPPPADR
ncbi:MAG: hypothetical protein ACOY94_16495 [Bacillota bacterium]